MSATKIPVDPAVAHDELLDALDVLERELLTERVQQNALPTPAHIAARRLLEKADRR